MTPRPTSTLAETAARFRDQGLTGWDLAGPEASFPDPMAHAAAFEAARAGGLRITVHAGEWGGAFQVRRALELEPERIAHGPGAVDDPELCAELIERRVTLDLCPTSNWQAGIVPSLAEHPLARLERVGVSVTLSTDDTTVSDITLSEEYLNAVETIGLTVPELWEIDLHALNVAFADEEDLRAGCGPSFAALGRGASRSWRTSERATPRGCAAAGGESLQGRGQLGGIGRDRGRLLVDGECLDLGPGRRPRSA